MVALDSFVTFPSPTWAFVVLWGFPESALWLSKLASNAFPAEPS